MPIFFEEYPHSPIGPLAIASTEHGLLAVKIGMTDLDAWSRGMPFRGADLRFEPGLFPAADQFSEYFDGRRWDFDLPLDLRPLTEFHRRVLAAVRAVPYGQTRTYVRVAAGLSKPGAARAVGRANATNPLPIVIPCHRLVGADGSLRGYGAPGGIKTKAWLLAFEAAQTNSALPNE
jgi:methylated-DNA-[protein]-cysteine S-methyltransferase